MDLLFIVERCDVFLRGRVHHDVEGNATSVYRLLNGVATPMGSYAWDTCLDSSVLMGKLFEPDGFWICQK